MELYTVPTNSRARLEFIQAELIADGARALKLSAVMTMREIQPMIGGSRARLYRAMGIAHQTAPHAIAAAEALITSIREWHAQRKGTKPLPSALHAPGLKRRRKDDLLL